MKDINISAKIISKRKEKGVTQEELANFLGVSKAAISKWESGISYPDITLLPLIATYYNTTIDDIMGYEPQMSKEEIVKLYKRLASDFAQKPFEEVFEACNGYLKKYYTCWELQMYIGLLFINHCSLAKDQEKVINILNNTIRIFDRIAKESQDIPLARKAISLQSFCYISINQPVMAIDLLESIKEQPNNVEILLAQAYQMHGDIKKAKNLVQGHIYQSLMGMTSACPNILALYTDDISKLSFWYDKYLELDKVFNLTKLHPASYLTIFLTAAQLFTAHGLTDKTLDCLSRYVEICTRKDLFPLKLHGDEAFDSLNDYFISLDLELDPPRNDAVIKNSLKEAVISNPAFLPLQENKIFLSLLDTLNAI